ncbi:MAG: shikimate dehydrogenase family protein [Chloroflexota bacterium]
MASNRYAIIGDPVDHSRSPAMQLAAFGAQGIEATYERLTVEEVQLVEVVKRLARQYVGFNVTSPHKQRILPLLDEIDPVATLVGSVNTVRCRGGRTMGFNTDVGGFRRVYAGLRIDPGVRVMIFGTGGAARALLPVLREAEAHVTLVSRASAETFLPDCSVIVLDDPSLQRAVWTSQLLINATPLGLAHFPDRSPVPREIRLNSETLVLDLIYGRKTPLLQQGDDAGCRTHDGLELLVQQGAEAFRLWTGLEADVSLMRQAVQEEASCSVI